MCFEGKRGEDNSNDMYACGTQKERVGGIGISLRQYPYGRGCTDTRSGDVHTASFTGCSSLPFAFNRSYAFVLSFDCISRGELDGVEDCLKKLIADINL